MSWQHFNHSSSYPFGWFQVRKKNVLKDFVAMAGPLGVTHFMIFSKTDNSVNMVRPATEQPNFWLSSCLTKRFLFLQRLARLPKGPTLNFRVLKVNVPRLCFKNERVQMMMLFFIDCLVMLLQSKRTDEPKLLKLWPQKHFLSRLLKCFFSFFVVFSYQRCSFISEEASDARAAVHTSSAHHPQ